MNTMDRPANAAFGHPLFLAALLVLVLNDHALKGAGLLPSAVTGKLSDVAGLLVAPAVLAWLLRARGPRGWIAAHALVGAGFAALELSPWLVGVVEAASLRIGLPMRMWPDPSDLLALPALALSYRVLGRRPEHAPRRKKTALVGAIALVACTASSGGNPPPRYPFRPRGVVEADVFLRHPGSEDLRVSVRRLRDEAEVDCARLPEDAPDMLEEGDFLDATEWTLIRGDGVPLWDRVSGAPDRECYAVRLVAGGHDWLLTWQHGAPPVEEMELRLDENEPPEPRAVLLGAGDEPPRVPSGVTAHQPR